MRLNAPAIYAAGVEDAPALAALHARAYARPWRTQDIADLLQAGGGFALCAGRPACGFVLARVAAGEAEILALAVAPEARCAGAGRALVEACAAHAGARGAEALWLEAAEDNLAARALYAAAGFEATGRRRGYYPRPGGRADALVLRRTLNRP